MLLPLFRTSDDRVAMLARVALGIVIVPHGAQALFVLTSGSSPDVALGIFAGIAVFAELVGGVALIVGFFGRVAAGAVALHMLAAVLREHWSVGFFMNWNGRQAGEGFEFHILAVTLALVVVIRGSGVLSLDRVLTIRSLLKGSDSLMA